MKPPQVEKILAHQKDAVVLCCLGQLAYCVVPAVKVGKFLLNIFGFVKTVGINLKQETKAINRWLRLMRFGKYLGCHQMPERSFFFRGYQFPVCARCTGVLIAVIIVIPLFFVYKINIIIAILLSGVMFLDWFIQYLGIYPSTNFRRLITGFLGGFGWTYVQLYFYQLCFHGIIRFLKS